MIWINDNDDDDERVRTTCLVHLQHWMNGGKERLRRSRPGNDTLRARITGMTTLKNRLLDDYNHVLHHHHHPATRRSTSLLLLLKRISPSPPSHVWQSPSRALLLRLCFRCRHPRLGRMCLYAAVAAAVRVGGCSRLVAHRSIANGGDCGRNRVRRICMIMYSSWSRISIRGDDDASLRLLLLLPMTSLLRGLFLLT